MPANNPHRKLAWAIISQALHDCVDPFTKRPKSSGTYKQLKDEAREWVTQPSEGLGLWLGVLGIDARRFMERARRWIVTLDEEATRDGGSSRGRWLW